LTIRGVKNALKIDDIMYERTPWSDKSETVSLDGWVGRMKTERQVRKERKIKGRQEGERQGWKDK
jgi:hypothetical protein